MPEADTLKQLALDTITHLVCRLCFKLTDCKKKKRNKTEVEETAGVSTASVETTRETCEIFHKLFVEKIPPALSNEVSNILLTSIDDWWCFDKKHLKFEDCQDILQEIVKSVIHPMVTRIGALRNTLDCYDLFTFCEFRTKIVVPLLQVHLPSLTNLKALDVRSQGTMRLSDIYIPEQLEEFSGYPDDQLLNRIITKCPRIKFLNIGDARKITNESVEPILKLDHLEKLNIGGTRISFKGRVRLLLGLSKKQTLKELRMSFTTSKRFLEIIYSLIPNVALSLCNDIDCEIFNHEHFDLENLSAIDIEGTLNDFVTLMPIIGNRLTFLSIGDLSFSSNEAVKNMLNAGSYLTSLKCFHLTYNVTMDDMDYEDFEHPLIDAFQSVVCLKVRSFSKSRYEFSKQHVLEHLLNQCVNVESLTVDWYRCFCDKQQFLEDLREKNSNVLKKLKEIYWVKDDDWCDCIDDEVAQFLIDNFPSLQIIGGLSHYSERQFPKSHRVRFLS